MAAVLRMKTAEDVRRALARLYRQLEKDEIDPPRARCMIYAAATLGSLIRDSDLEARLDALEAAQAQEGNQ